jgi:hypothetical protein
VSYIKLTRMTWSKQLCTLPKVDVPLFLMLKFDIPNMLTLRSQGGSAMPIFDMPAAPPAAYN